MDEIQDEKDRHRPKKSWGYEEWIVNNDLYCGKRLHFTERGGSTSMHFHVRKHETMYADKGMFCIGLIDTNDASYREVMLHEGESIVIPPLTIHRITSKSDSAVLIEFSTHHEDDDSYRVLR